MRKLFRNEHNDERINSEFNKYGCQTSIILLVLLFCDCVVKGVFLNKDITIWISSLVLFIIGSGYMTLQIFLKRLICVGSSVNSEKEIKRLRLKNILVSSSIAILDVLFGLIQNETGLKVILIRFFITFIFIYSMNTLLIKLSK